MVVISESEKGMRSKSATASLFCLEARDADWEIADAAGTADSAAYPAWNPAVDRDPATCRAASIRARIAAVAVTDDATTNHSAQNSAEDSART
jgi:hypothetical protein